jgi:NitT/TauT family transport system permease protein
LRKAIIYFILFTLLLVCWHTASIKNNNLRLLISNPVLSLQYFQAHSSNIFKAFFYTAIESFLGFLIAVLFSFILVFICLLNRKLFEFILPLMIVSQVIPIITLAPLFIVLLGIGLKSKIAMATLLCFFPIFVNLAAGVNSVEKNFQNLFDMYNASRLVKIKKLFFPLATPYIFSGLKISSTLAVVGAIVAEFNGAEIGLGKNLFLAAKRLDAELMINSIFFSCLLGGIFYLMVFFLEKHIGKWYIKKQKQ